MKTDIFLADYYTATYVQSLVIQYVNFFVNKSMFNVHNMNMTKDLLHEKKGEKRQIKFPEGKKDTEDPKNRTRTKTNRAKTKRHKKTRKTSTKRPRRRGGNGSFGNFNFNFTISAGRHFQHHLHHRLKKKRGRKETEQNNTKYVDQTIRHRNQKPKSREDHKRPVEAYSRQLPLSPPQLELQDLCMSCTYRKRLQCRGEGERHSFSDNNLFFNPTTDRAPPVLKRPEYLDEDLSGNHLCDLKPVYNP